MLLRVMYLSIVCVLCYTHTSLNSNSNRKSSELKASENKNNIDDDGDDDVQPHDSWISTEKKRLNVFFSTSHYNEKTNDFLVLLKTIPLIIHFD